MAKQKKKDAIPESNLSLREEILGKLSEDEFELKKREISVMTRLNRDYVEILDALVKLELFKSRSEAVAAIVMKTLHSEYDVFQELKVQAEKLDDFQDTVKDLAFKALRE
ncbi:MAG: hypothetical protein ACXADL_04125 [Candidatus Thorarchaeota archaeon]